MFIYLRTKRGVIHRAVEGAGDQLLTDERCNIDDAERPLEVFEVPPEAGDWCKNCFPQEEDSSS